MRRFVRAVAGFQGDLGGEPVQRRQDRRLVCRCGRAVPSLGLGVAVLAVRLGHVPVPVALAGMEDLQALRY